MEAEVKLVLTDMPKPDEALLGYLLRLSQLNLYKSPKFILSLAGLKEYFIFEAESTNFTKLSIITSTNPDILKSMAYPRDDKGRYKIYNFSVPRNYIQPYNTRICPLCLKESMYIRKAWDYSLYTTCFYHGVLLIDTCPDCGKKIRWDRQNISYCPCSYNYLQSPITPVEDPYHKINSRFYFPKYPSEHERNIENHLLNCLSYDEFFSLIITISKSITILLGGKSSIFTLDNSTRHELLELVTLIFHNWPINFFEFLSWCKMSDSKKTLNNKRIAYLYRRFYFDSELLRFDFVRYAFEEYLALYWDISDFFEIKDIKIRDSCFSDGKYVSLLGACFYLNVRAESIVYFVVSGMLDFTVQEQLEIILFYKEQLYELRQRLNQAIGMKEAKEILKISNKQLMKLIDEGHITVLRSPEHDGSKKWLLCKDSVMDLSYKMKIISFIQQLFSFNPR